MIMMHLCHYFSLSSAFFLSFSFLSFSPFHSLLKIGLDSRLSLCKNVYPSTPINSKTFEKAHLEAKANALQQSASVEENMYEPEVD